MIRHAKRLFINSHHHISRGSIATSCFSGRICLELRQLLVNSLCARPDCWQAWTAIDAPSAEPNILVALTVLDFWVTGDCPVCVEALPEGWMPRYQFIFTCTFGHWHIVSSTKTTIAFCQTSSGELTGASKMILRLASGLDDDLFQPLIVSQLQGKLVARARDRGIPSIIVPYYGILDTYERELVSTSLIQNIRIGARLVQYNYEIHRALDGVDIIWCDSIRTLLTLAPTALSSNSTIIWNVGLGMKSKGIYKWMNELGFRLADHVFIESKIQARRLYDDQFEKNKQKFTIFHKGIDTEKYAPRAPPAEASGDSGNHLRIGTAATLTKRKGHVNAIDAIANTVNRFPGKSIEYVIAGGTSQAGHQEYKQQVEERIDHHNLADTVKFMGWVGSDDMPAFYNSLDIFILASESEGIPGAVREALSTGCAVIATDVGGTSEAVLDGETGYLVPPNDSEALADAIATLIAEPNTRTEFAKNGRSHMVENFSYKSYVTNYEEFLQQILPS